MKHKHAELIKAWADGAQVQYFYHGEWVDWESYTSPSWGKTIEYRIKPEPKPDVVLRTFLRPVTSIGMVYNEGAWNDERANISLTFDGETGKLKTAEVL
jgi:hypothetical protein